MRLEYPTATKNPPQLTPKNKLMVVRFRNFYCMLPCDGRRILRVLLCLVYPSPTRTPSIAERYPHFDVRFYSCFSRLKIIGHTNRTIVSFPAYQYTSNHRLEKYSNSAQQSHKQRRIIPGFFWSRNRRHSM